MGTVATGADLWDAGGRSADDLLRGGRLQSALDWRAASAPDLTAVESEYLDASADAHQSELARERRQNRRLRWALSGAAALLVVALVAGGFAVVQGRRGRQSPPRDQRIEALAATSLSTARVGSGCRRPPRRGAAAPLARRPARAIGAPRKPRGGRRTGVATRLRRRRARVRSALIPGTRTVLMITDRPPADRRHEAGPPAWRSSTSTRGRSSGSSTSIFRPLDTQFRRDVVVSGDGRIAAVQTGEFADAGQARHLLRQLADLHRPHDRRACSAAHSC